MPRWQPEYDSAPANVNHMHALAGALLFGRSLLVGIGMGVAARVARLNQKVEWIEGVDNDPRAKLEYLDAGWLDDGLSYLDRCGSFGATFDSVYLDTWPMTDESGAALSRAAGVVCKAQILSLPFGHFVCPDGFTEIGRITFPRAAVHGIRVWWKDGVSHQWPVDSAHN